MDGSDLYDPDVNDLLRYLDFSEPEPLLPLAPIQPLPQQLDDGLIPTPDPPGSIQDDQIWDLSVLGPMIEGVANINIKDPNKGKAPIEESPYPHFQPLVPGELDCSECCILRELFHTNGFENTKVVIHGGGGLFYHATFHVEDACDLVDPMLTAQNYYIDLGIESHDWVKNFLHEYTTQIVASGAVILQDSISNFYQALCSGGLNKDLPSTSSGQPASSGSNMPVIIPELLGLPPPTPRRGLLEGNTMGRMPKSGIAAQRERTGSMTLREVADYYHLPIANAAKELNICSTALKHICRKYGLDRWPHRKISSLDKKIARLEASLRGRGRRSSEEIASILEELEKLKAKRAKIYGNLRG